MKKAIKTVEKEETHVRQLEKNVKDAEESLEKVKGQLSAAASAVDSTLTVVSYSSGMTDKMGIQISPDASEATINSTIKKYLTASMRIGQISSGDTIAV